MRQRVVVAVPDVAESRTLSSWLESEGYEAVQRSTQKGAADEVMSQPFDLLVADGTFMVPNGLRAIGRARVPETPAVVVGDAGVEKQCAALGAQAMFVERPIDRATFICMVTMAMMDARPERRSPRRPVKPFEATVNGVRSHIIDVSKEGVRLELPRDRRMLMPQFTLRVPMLGVALAVHRMWVRAPRPDERIEVMWCGGALGQNSAMAEQGWLSFIDTLPAEGTSIE